MIRRPPRSTLRQRRRQRQMCIRDRCSDPPDPAMRHRRIQGEDQGGVHRRHGSGNRGGAVMSYFQARLAEVQIPPKKPQKYLFHVPRTEKAP